MARRVNTAMGLNLYQEHITETVEDDWMGVLSQISVCQSFCVSSLLGSAGTRQLPISSRTPTSRCRFATADHPGQDRESPPAVGRAASGTRADLYSRPRL